MGPGLGLYHVDRRRGIVSQHLTPEQVKNYRIAIIVPWTAAAELPEWGNYALSSISTNSDLVDWIWIANEDEFHPPSNLPANVKLLWLTHFNELWRTQMKLAVSMVDTSSLATMKSLYGYVLEKELKEYTHWGFSTMDVIYGTSLAYLVRIFLMKLTGGWGTNQKQGSSLT